MKRTSIVVLTLAITAAACGGDEGADDTSPTSAATTAGTSAPTVTVPEPSSSTTLGEETTTSTEGSTTTGALTSDPGVVLAQEKVARVEAAMPADYSFTTAVDADPEEDNTLFTSCLSAGSFDLNQLDDVTTIAYDIEFDTPDVGVFGAASGQLEVRVFDSVDSAAAAFATLEELLGTDEGRACVGAELAAIMSADAGEDAEVAVAVEPGPLLGEASARIIITMTISGFDAVLYFDLVASREGDCTVYSVFQAFDEPFDEEAANQLLFAAFGG